MAWYTHNRRIPDPCLAEFRQWTAPAQLIAHINPSSRSQNFIIGLLQRLETGLMFAGAGIATWRDRDGRNQKRWGPMSIESEWWDQAADHREYWETLWTLGDFSATLWEDGCYFPVRFSDVRFEASRLFLDGVVPRPPAPEPPPMPRAIPTLGEQLALLSAHPVTIAPRRPRRSQEPSIGPAEAIPRPRKRRAEKGKPVLQQEVLDWAATLPPAERKKGHRDLRAMAVAHFHPRPVMKKLIDPLTEGRDKGRQRKAD
jgi:hypothetical protein